MKRVLTPHAAMRIAIVFLSSLLPLQAQTNTVSLPAGFVRVIVPTNSEVLLSVPFDLLPSPDINDALYGQLTGATNEIAADVIRKWDAVAGSYQSVFKAHGVGQPHEDLWFNDFSTWSTSTLSIAPGEGFFIGNRQSTTQSVFLCGLVVLDEGYAVPLYSGFNLFGSPYPHAQSLNDATLVASGAQGANPATDGDQITDNAAGLNYWLLSDTNSPNHLKWVNTNGVASALSLNTGAGFWYWRRGTNGFNWTESRPYADPFPTNMAPPTVQDMYPNEAGDEVTLDIQTTGEAGELLEVYYKDLTATDTFNSFNWLIGVTDLDPIGSNAIYWVDAGSSNRPAVSTVHSRYYLVGRGDIDQDSDDLPDSRETFVHGTDPADYDTDDDNLGDGAELGTHNTDPLNADTDADGIKDGTEVGYGNSPATSNTYSVLPFVELFETNTVTAGELNGQNRWEVEPQDGAFVQTNIVYEGEQAIKIAGCYPDASVRHLFASPTSSVVWVDIMMQAFDAALPNEIEGSACMMFANGRQLHVYDGEQPYTNRWTTLTNHPPLEDGQWVRLTSCSDYASQQWLVCLNGIKLAEGLGFASDTAEFSAITLAGEKGYVDNIRVTPTMPEGISVDGDTLPDLWEIQHLGSTTNSGSADNDSDGLTNAEEYDRGTSPSNSDSDGDGISDGLEVYYDADPALSNLYARLPFLEFFETNTVTVGELDGQNNWGASPTGRVEVQAEQVYQGQQSMRINPTNSEPAMVRQLFAAPTSSVVWVDLMLDVRPSLKPESEPDGAALFGFSHSGYAWAYDGSKPFSNAVVNLVNMTPCTTGTWARLTARLDYGNQEWLICVDSILAAEGLGFASPVASFCAVDMTGEEGLLDSFSVGLMQPAGLSLDGDHMPDDWEATHFGNTSQIDSGDPDDDNMTNLQEYQNGTDPTDSDSDDDGMPDGWEVAAGLDGTDPSDASSDIDSDGLPNLAEYENGTDPTDSDSDDDGLTDGSEVSTYLTNPADSDSDADGYEDGFEVAKGLDPCDAESRPYTNWSHRLKLKLRDGVTGTEPLYDVPVAIILKSERLDYTQIAPNGTDLLIGDPNADELDFEIADWNTNGASVVWVRIPEVNTTNAPAHIWLHWGNPAYTNSPNGAKVWTNGYEGVWHLDADSDSLDDALADNTATNSGAVRVDGILGHARDFQGADSIIIPSDAFASISSAITLSIWQFGDGVQPQNDSLFGGSSVIGRELNVHAPWGNGYVYWDAFGNFDRIYRAASSNDYEGQWNQWTFTKDVAAGVMKIYLNGELWHSGAGKTLSCNPITSFRLGSYDTGVYGYDGIIDEFRVSAVARSDEWIALQYASMSDDLFIYGEQSVSIETGDTGAEPDTHASFIVSRTAEGTNLPLTINYTVTGGSATEGADFEAMPGSVIIPIGALDIAVSVRVQDDYWLEGAETVDLALAAGDYSISCLSNAAQTSIADDDIDSDADGLADGWELLHFGNLDQTAAGDPDADGADNLAECQNSTDPDDSDSDDDGLSDGFELDFLPSALNPNSTDTDDDGMPDKWELDSGTNPLDPADAADDPDGDNVLNLDEYEHGLNPTNQVFDTDADGIYDYGEIYIFGTGIRTNDTDADGIADGTLVALVEGTNTTYRGGQWEPQGSALSALSSLNARLEYSLSVTNADMYWFGIELANCHTNATNSKPFTIQFLIDDTPCGWMSTTVSTGATARAFAVTPWLPEGEHTFRLAWLDDYDSEKLLSVHELTLHAIDATDGDTNGVQDWVESILDERLDTDGDGLADVDEIDAVSVFGLRSALNPLSLDTDGDTLSDGEELDFFGTDPLATDSDTNGVPDALTLISLSGAQTDARDIWHITGTLYQNESDSLYAYSTSFEASYDLTVTNAGVYRVGVRVRNFYNDPPDNYLFSLQTTVNGYGAKQTNTFADVDLSGTGYLLTPWLIPGTHRIGVRWLNNQSGNGRDANVTIETVSLQTIDAPDSDNNGIQDWEETSVLALKDVDTDDDGLSDYDEIMTYGTSATTKDSDNDTLSDGEEVALGTKPLLTDSDGDGISDAAELTQSFTDPLTNEFGSITVVADIFGRSAVTNQGAWQQEDDAIYSRERRGSLSYDIDLPSNGTYAVQFDVTQHNHLTSQGWFYLGMHVDGTTCGYQAIYAPYGITNQATFFLPHLPVGTHRVQLEWVNLRQNTFLQVSAVHLLAFSSDQWLSSRLSSVAKAGSPPATSWVSPLCVEGESKFPNLVNVNVDYIPDGQTQQVVTVKEGVGDDWYANVELSPTNATALLVEDQNGEFSFGTNVLWTPLNLFDTTTTNLPLRSADSLMLNAVPVGATNGQSQIDVYDAATNLLTNAVLSVDDAFVYTFDAVGDYTVSAAYSNGVVSTNGLLSVEAVAGEFGTNVILCLVGGSRTWEAPGLPISTPIQHDPDITQFLRTPTADDASYITFALDDILAHHIVSRTLTNGPVIDAAALRGMYASDGDYWRHTGTLNDGTQLIELRISLGYVPEDISVVMEIFVGGVTFKDGTTVKTLTAADFDEMGEATVFYLKAATVTSSICHRTKFYQADQQL